MFFKCLTLELLLTAFKSFTFLFLVILIAILIIPEFKKDETLVARIVLMALELGQAIQLPICIGLTLRVAMRKKKTSPVIPQEPVFHDDPYLKPSEVEDNQMIELGSVSTHGLQDENQETQNDSLGCEGFANVIQVQPCEGVVSHHF